MDISRVSEAGRALGRKRPRGHRRAVGAVLAVLIAVGAALAPSSTTSATAADRHGPAHARYFHSAHSPSHKHKSAHTKRHRHSHPRHPSIRRGPARRHSPHAAKPAGSAIAASPHANRGTVAVHFALSQVGKPYSYGGVGPDTYDCSGLTQRSWKAAGISIPRTTQAQAAFGTPVAPDRIQPGDLVIFYSDASHVGIYSGDGKVVAAPHTGALVRVEPMKWMPVYAIRRPG